MQFDSLHPSTNCLSTYLFTHPPVCLCINLSIACVQVIMTSTGNKMKLRFDPNGCFVTENNIYRCETHNTTKVKLQTDVNKNLRRGYDISPKQLHTAHKFALSSLGVLKKDQVYKQALPHTGNLAMLAVQQHTGNLYVSQCPAQKRLHSNFRYHSQPPRLVTLKSKG